MCDDIRNSNEVIKGHNNAYELFKIKPLGVY